MSSIPQAKAHRPLLYRSRAWLSLMVMAPATILTVFSTPVIELSDTSALLLAIVGWGMFWIGAFFRWWATLYIGGRKDYKLLTSDGPYSVIRHPLYFGTVLIGASTAFFLDSGIYAAALAITAFIYLGITLPKEEQTLIGNYGDNYRSYMNQVPRFWPRWSNYQSSEVIEVKIQGLQSELIRTLRWMWAPVIAHVVGHLRHEAWWPHWISIW